jgi:hypothetical protein
MFLPLCVFKFPGPWNLVPSIHFFSAKVPGGGKVFVNPTHTQRVLVKDLSRAEGKELIFADLLPLTSSFDMSSKPQ